jgi:hypothetical protein
MPSKQSATVRRRWEAARLAMVEPGFEAPDDTIREMADWVRPRLDL